MAEFSTDPQPSAGPLEGDGPLAQAVGFAAMVGRRFRARELAQLLTVFTMAIGAFALAATLFTGQGALENLWRDLDRLMGDHVFVFPDAGPNDIIYRTRPTPDLTPQDLEFVRTALGAERIVAPRYFGRARVETRGRTLRVAVDGITRELHQQQLFRPLMGRGFDSANRKALARECLLTLSAARELAIDGDQLPAAVAIDGDRFQVVGLVPDPPEADERFRLRAVVPFSYAQLRWGRVGVVPSLVVYWSEPRQAFPTIKAIEEALDSCRGRHAYGLSSYQFKLRDRRRIVTNFILFGAAQAFFCVLVGSIGIVNVMLANVVRRAREFAIRVSLGAEPSHLMVMVLGESALLGFVGAIAGIATAFVLAPPICAVLSSRFPEASQLQPHFSLIGILSPLAVCGVSGLVAGVIPALKVRSLDILSVLRME